MSIKRVISKGNELRLPDIVDLDTGCGILAVETVKVSCKTTQIASRQPQFRRVQHLLAEGSGSGGIGLGSHWRGRRRGGRCKNGTPDLRAASLRLARALWR